MTDPSQAPSVVHPLTFGSRDRFTDRSRIVTDWNCPRKRWWNYEVAGRGVVGANLAIPLFLGIALHDGLAVIATQWQADGIADIDTIAAASQRAIYVGLMNASSGDEDAHTWAREQAALVEGILHGFYRFRWPQLIAQWPRIVAVEQEVTLKLGEHLTFMSKPDLLLANDTETVYIEYKSTSSKKEQWVNSWTTAVQLHSSIRAVEATLGIKAEQAVIVGLYKGYESYGKQNSPFCYAYRRQGNPPFTKDEVRYDYAAGFKRYPTWELPGGTSQWVADMPDEVLAEQFPTTPAIFIKDDLVDAFFSQVASREAEIALAHQMIAQLPPEDATNILNISFPQHFDQCSPAWGSGCSYKMLCHAGITDPIAHGWQLRESHHAPEAEQHALESHE